MDRFAGRERRRRALAAGDYAVYAADEALGCVERTWWLTGWEMRAAWCRWARRALS